MQDRSTSHRLSQKKKSLTPPPNFSRRGQTEINDEKKRRPKASLSPGPQLERLRSHPRNNAHHNWVTDWENQSSPVTLDSSPHESSSGLLCVRSRSGWTSQTWQSQSEVDSSLQESQKTPKKQDTQSNDVNAELLCLKSELQRMHGENVSKRSRIICDLQELVKQRDHLYPNKHSTQETSSAASAEAAAMERNQAWIQSEVDRLGNEFDFKSQVAELLRTTLLKTKVQRTKIKSVTQSEALLSKQQRQSSIHDSSKSVMGGQTVDLQMSEDVRDLEREIANLEAHLKLLNDALDDEKQENYELAKENAILREQVQPLNQKT